MAFEVADIMTERYDRKFFMLDIPEAFDHLYSQDASFESAISSTLQPVRLIFTGNTVAQSIGHVFNNSALYKCLHEDIIARSQDEAEDYDYNYELSSEAIVDFNVAMSILEKLKFDMVKIHHSLTKSQTIEKMDLIQCEAEDQQENNTHLPITSLERGVLVKSWSKFLAIFRYLKSQGPPNHHRDLGNVLGIRAVLVPVLVVVTGPVFDALCSIVGSGPHVRQRQ